MTGHQELPPAAVSLLRQRLDGLRPQAPRIVVVCSLAVGADSVVAEHMLDAGARLQVIVPCLGYEETFHGKALDHYWALLRRAYSVERMPFPEPTEQAFLAAGYRVVDQSESLLAVWDGEPARGLGGTADVVAQARRLGKQVEVVWPAGLRR